MAFESNVFINCPFDDEYKALLRPMIFSIIYFGLEPRISRTESSANIRINQIKNHIRESMYGIHDLSRCKPLKRNELPRFNMPYELGLDIGCCEYGGRKYKQKRILVLETERYHYQKVLSDIAGQDIEAHDDDPSTLVRKIRNWFSTVTDKRLAAGSTVWIAYNQFYEDMSRTLKAEGFTTSDIEDMPASDFIKFARDWIADFLA